MQNQAIEEEDEAFVGVGLDILAHDGRYVVCDVTSGGAADLDGQVEKGDVLISVDDGSVADWSLDGLKRRLHGVRGSCVNLCFERHLHGNDKQRFTVCLERGAREITTRDQIGSLRRQLEASQGQLINTRKALHIMEQQCARHVEESETFKRAHKTADAELQALHAQLATERKQKMSFESNLTAVNEAAARDKEDNDKLRKLLADAVGKLKSLQTQCSTLTEKSQADESERRAEEQRRKESEEREKKIRMQLEEALNEKKLLDMEMTSLAKRFSDSETQMRSVGKRLEEVEGRLEQKARENNELVIKLRDAESELRGYSRREIADAAAVEQLRTRLMEEETKTRDALTRAEGVALNLTTAETRNSQLVEQVATLQFSLKQKTAELEAAKDALATEELRRKEQENEWKRQLSLVEQSKDVEEQRAERLRKTLREMDDEKSEIAKLITENAALQSEVSRYRSLAAESASEVRSTRAVVDEEHQARVIAERELDRVHKELKEISTEHVETKRSCTNLKDKQLIDAATIKSLEDENALLRQENRTVQCTVHEVQRELSLYKERMQGIEITRNEMMVKLVSLQHELVESQGKVAELSSLSTLVSDLQSVREENAQLKVSINQSQRELEDERGGASAARAAEAEIARLRSKLSSEAEEAARLRATVQSQNLTEQELVRLRAAVAQGERDAAELSSVRIELSSAVSEVIKLRGGLAEANIAVQKANAALQQEEMLRQEAEDAHRILFSRFNSQSEDCSALRARVADLSDKEHNLSMKSDSLSRSLSAAEESKNAIEVEYNRLRSDYTSCFAELQEIRRIGLRHEERTASEGRSLKSLEAEVEKLRAENGTMYEELQKARVELQLETDRRSTEQKLKIESLEREKKAREALEAELWRSRDHRRQEEDTSRRIEELERDLAAAHRAKVDAMSRRGDSDVSVFAQEKQDLLERIRSISNELLDVTAERDRLRTDLADFFKLPSPVGVGIEVESDSLSVRVKSLVSGMSAQQSGAINVGDEILTIDRHAIPGLLATQVRDYIVGKRGTQVSITLRRKGKMFAVTLRRGAFGPEHAIVSSEEQDTMQIQPASSAYAGGNGSGRGSKRDLALSDAPNGRGSKSDTYIVT